FDGTDMISGTNLSDINFSLTLKHPYIIRSHEFILTRDYMGIVMDTADNDLYDYMSSRELGYVEQIKYMYQIACALDYMSSQGYVHCDLTPNNILMKNKNLLLADFVLTRIKEYIDPYFC